MVDVESLKKCEEEYKQTFVINQDLLKPELTPEKFFDEPEEKRIKKLDFYQQEIYNQMVEL